MWSKASTRLATPGFGWAVATTEICFGKLIVIITELKGSDWRNRNGVRRGIIGLDASL